MTAGPFSATSGLVKKRKPKPDHRNTFAFKLTVADEETRRPRSRTYDSGGRRIAACLTLYDNGETLDARGRTYTVRGQSFFPWRERIWADGANADRSDRREASECNMAALACALLGIEGIEMIPLRVVPGEPDVRLARQDGSEVYVEVTQARTAADYQRQVAIREIRDRVGRRVSDERIEIDGNLSFMFRDCPGERDLDDTVEAILPFIDDVPSWPKPRKTIEPASPALAPYCRIGRNLAAEPLNVLLGHGALAHRQSRRDRPRNPGAQTLQQIPRQQVVARR
jgi:hypothetical protein